MSSTVVKNSIKKLQDRLDEIPDLPKLAPKTLDQELAHVNNELEDLAVRYKKLISQTISDADRFLFEQKKKRIARRLEELKSGQLS